MSASVDSLHRHEHAHADEPVHAHPHHHRTDERGEHGHAPYFERYTYIVSPVHALDPRAKLVAALALVLAVSLSPLHIVEIGLVAVLLAAVTVASRLPLAELGWRSALVLPFAGAVAVLSPLQAMAGGLPVAGAGWGGAAGVLAKAWLSAYCLVLVTATTPVPRLIEGLRRLWLPTVVVTLLSFVYRYVSVLAEQVRSMRRALASRGFGLGRLATLRLYGNLAGNLFVRSYERGERVHSAMLARGYDGRLPIAEPLALRGADALTVVVALLTAAAVLSY